MTEENIIPPHIRRFLLTSIDSIPHLEALLLIRQNPDLNWDAALLANSLYIQPKAANDLLLKMAAAGFLNVKSEGSGDIYTYNYPPLEKRQMLEELAALYSKYLVLITNFIHNKSSKAQQFADAFKFKKN